MKTTAKYRYPDMELTEREVRAVGSNRFLDSNLKWFILGTATSMIAEGAAAYAISLNPPANLAQQILVIVLGVLWIVGFFLLIGLASRAGRRFLKAQKRG